MMQNDEYVIARYRQIYDNMGAVLLHKSAVGKDIDRDIASIEILARLAWYFHPGFYVDPFLENHILRIGAILPDVGINHKKGQVPGPDSRLSIVHIATQVYSTGGHTRLLLNIIKRDKTSAHSLILAKQGAELVPSWLIDAVIQSGGKVHLISENTASKKAIQIRAIIQAEASLVMLHIHPDDAVSLVAVATCTRPPVIFVNHADHVFALGTTLTELVACIRVWALDFTLKRRAAKRVALLPAPLDFSQHYIPAKSKARQDIDVSDEQVMLLSVASAYKFVPNAKFNYFKLLKEVVDKHPSVTVKVIGVGHGDAELVGYVESARIELVGRLENPIDYYVAADIYVDSMPLSSITSLWEGIYFGAYPMLNYDPIDKLKHEAEPAISHAVIHPQNKEQWMERISVAIKNKDYREKIGAQCSANVQHAYASTGWNSYLNKIYDIAINSPVELMKTCYIEHVLTSDDFDSAAHSKLVNEVGNNYLTNLFYDGVKKISLVELIKLSNIVYKAQLRGGAIGFLRNYISLIKHRFLSK